MPYTPKNSKYGGSGSSGYSSSSYGQSSGSGAPLNSLLLGRSYDYSGRSGFSSGYSSAGGGGAAGYLASTGYVPSFMGGYGGSGYFSSGYTGPTKLTFGPLATISETGVLPSSAGQRRLPRSYVPPSMLPSPGSYSPAPKKPVVFDTENIDVTTPRKPSTAKPGDINREKTFGTIKRGRTVIRIRTQNLKENPYLSEEEQQQRKEERLKETDTESLLQKLRNELRDDFDINKKQIPSASQPTKKLAGDKFREKFMIQSKKKKEYAGYKRPSLSDIRGEQELLQKELKERLAIIHSVTPKSISSGEIDLIGEKEKMEQVKERLSQLDRRIQRRYSKALKKAVSSTTDEDSSTEDDRSTVPKLRKSSSRNTLKIRKSSSKDAFKLMKSPSRDTLKSKRQSIPTTPNSEEDRKSPMLKRKATQKFFFPQEGSSAVQMEIVDLESIAQPDPEDDFEKNILAHRATTRRTSNQNVKYIQPRKSSIEIVDLANIIDVDVIKKCDEIVKEIQKPEIIPISEPIKEIQKPKVQKVYKKRKTAVIVAPILDLKTEESSPIIPVKPLVIEKKIEKPKEVVKKPEAAAISTKNGLKSTIPFFARKTPEPTSSSSSPPQLQDKIKSDTEEKPQAASVNLATDQMSKSTANKPHLGKSTPMLETRSTSLDKVTTPQHLETLKLKDCGKSTSLDSTKSQEQQPQPSERIDEPKKNETEIKSPISVDVNKKAVEEKLSQSVLEKNPVSPLTVTRLTSNPPQFSSPPPEKAKVASPSPPRKNVAPKIAAKTTPPQSPKKEIGLANKFNVKKEVTQFTFDKIEAEKSRTASPAELSPKSPVKTEEIKKTDDVIKVPEVKSVVSIKPKEDFKPVVKPILSPKTTKPVVEPKPVTLTKNEPKPITSKSVIEPTPVILLKQEQKSVIETKTVTAPESVQTLIEKELEPKLEIEHKSLFDLINESNQNEVTPLKDIKPNLAEPNNKTEPEEKVKTPEPPKSVEDESKPSTSTEANKNEKVKPGQKKYEPIKKVKPPVKSKSDEKVIVKTFATPKPLTKVKPITAPTSPTPKSDILEEENVPTIIAKPTTPIPPSEKVQEEKVKIEEKPIEQEIQPSTPPTSPTLEKTAEVKVPSKKKRLVKSKSKSTERAKKSKSLTKAKDELNAIQSPSEESISPSQEISQEGATNVAENKPERDNKNESLLKPDEKETCASAPDTEPNSMEDSSEEEDEPKRLIERLRACGASEGSSSSGSSTASSTLTAKTGSTSSTGSSSSGRSRPHKPRIPSPPVEDDSDEETVSLDKICPAKNRPKYRKYEVEDFQFLKVLGKGSFGKVLLAELKETDSYFAIKCLKKDVVLEDDDVECTMIERKVLLMGSKHPYLCHLFCTFQTESHLFFVMEYLNGGDLMFHIQQSGKFTEERGRFYGAEIVSGLKFLHKKGVMYRDLKLDNILLDYEGHIRIADFGMCKLQIYLDRTADTFCGTPDYMAPEIIKGLRYNQCVDWWAFGVLLYEMLVGQSPFSGSDEDELFWSVCNEAVHFPKFLSKESIWILERLLEKDASRRLGMASCAYGDVKQQVFFNEIDWDKLEKREVEPPYRPKLKHPLDVQYFDTTFTKEIARLTPVDKAILQSMDQTQFDGFSYTNPHTTD